MGKKIALFFLSLCFALAVALPPSFAQEITETPTPIEEITPAVTPTIELSPTATPEPTKEPSATLTPTLEPTPTEEVSPTPDPSISLQELTPPPVSLPTPEPPRPIPGRAEGEGTDFTLEDTIFSYSIHSTSPIKGVFESANGNLTLNFETDSSNQSTLLSITGLQPNFNYHLYTDDFHNHREVPTDENGVLVFEQDILTHHLLMIQPLASTKYIRNDGTGGNCTSIGNWNNTTKTCTLTMDVTETIQIDSSGVTLDGNGFKLIPPVGTSNGVYFKSGITGSKVKNLTILNATYAINLYQASNNFVENVTTSSNGSYGIQISNNSNNNTITNSRFTGAYCGTQLYQSGNNVFTNNTFSGNSYIGVYLYNGSHGNTFTNNQILDNNRGVDVDTSNNNIFTGNTISRSYGNEHGIYLWGNSNNNQFKDNIVYKNGQYGVKFYPYNTASSGNLFEHNLISDHLYYGIYGSSAGANTYKNNVILANSNVGITLGGATGNTVSGNYISGGSYGIYIGSNSNTISGNIVHNANIGIYTQYASSNTISNNIAKNNTGAGISLGYTSHSNIVKFNSLSANRYGLGINSPANNNQIYNNNFLGNTTQVNVPSGTTGNVFNLAAPTGGNYWNNWFSPDNNGDGFVDNAYIFTNGRDNFPWTKINGWAGGFQTTDNAPTTWQNSNVNIVLICKDKNNNTCDQTFYRIDGGAWQNGTSFYVNTEGFHLIEYYSVHQGITEETKITHALLDKTQPNLSGGPTKPPYWNTWYNRSVLVQFNETDTLSGIQTPAQDTMLSWDGANQSVQGIAHDKAGNYKVFAVTGINIDLTPPVTTASFTGEHGSGNWYKSDVNVTLTAADAGSGVKTTEYSFDQLNWQTYTGPFSITNEGLNKFYFRSIDNVDNVENAIKTTTTVFSNDLKNYTPSHWPNPTYLPGFSGRPQSLSACGIQFSGQPRYDGYCLQSTEAVPNSGKRRAISYNQNFTLGSDTRIDFAALPRFGTDGTSPFEIVIYDTASNKYVRIAAREISYYNRTIQTEISGFGLRESGSLWTDGVWLLFRLESKDGKVKISVLNTNEDILWSTTYDVNLLNLITTYRLSFGSYAENGQNWQLSYYPVADDIKIFNTNWVYKSADINIDKTLPVVNVSFAGIQGANNWYIDDVTATLTATDNNAIDTIEYSYDNINWQTYSAPIALTSSGETTFYYKTFDFAGNSTGGQQVIKIDKAAPTSVIVLSGFLGSGGWYTSDVTATLTAVDSEGGMGEDGIHYSFDNTTWQIYTQPIILTDQDTTIYFYAQDLAGNSEAIHHTTVKIDKVSPTTSIQLSGGMGNNGWYRSDISIGLSAIDNEGGMSLGKTEYSFDTTMWFTYTLPILITSEGSLPLYYRSIDSAGNIEQTQQQAVHIDKTAPEVTGSRTPLPNIQGWNNEDVTVHFECVDGFSGVETVSPDHTLITEGAGQSVDGICTDAAGNESTLTIGDINIDKTKPTATGAPTSYPNANGWYKSDVTVHFEGTDALSGVDTSTPDRLVNWEGAGIAIDGAVTDKAGNVQPVRVNDINIDTTPPMISVLSPTHGVAYLLHQIVIANWSATDSLSTVVSSWGTTPSGLPIVTYTVGPKEFTVTAEDYAGNTTRTDVQYDVWYKFGGILQPINPNGSSVIKLGRVVPVKFQLFDRNGNIVFTAVPRLYLAKINNNVIGSEIEADAPGQANDGNLFRYDSTNEQYIFNLSTKSLSTGTWQLRIETEDGNEQFVIISVIK